MCGIVGVVGNANATDILIQGLEKLEYRGYDSAGIFVTGGEQAHLVKAVGRIAELSAKVGDKTEGTTGIGHTAGQLTANQLRIMPTHIPHKQVVSSLFTTV